MAKKIKKNRKSKVAKIIHYQDESVVRPSKAAIIGDLCNQVARRRIMAGLIRS